MIPLSHLHPMLVHFPIALIVFGFLTDIASLLFRKEVCLTRAGLYMLVAGTVMAFAALLSGTLFTSEMSGTAGDVKETHELFAWLTLGLLVITSSIRVYLLLKKPDSPVMMWTSFALYGLSCISVSITGYLGGTLVFSYMMPL